MAPVDVVVERRYRDGDLERLEQVTWRHVPDPDPAWRLKPRRWRKPTLVMVRSGQVADPRGRPLPEWCTRPDVTPNRWVWFQGVFPAADLTAVTPDRYAEDGTRFYDATSAYWDYYRLPLRAGCVLL